MQGTWVRSLVRELRPHMPRGNKARAPQLLISHTSTREAACHKLQSPHTLEPARHNYRAHALWNPRATTTESMCSGTCAPQLEKRKPHATTRENPAQRNQEPTCSNERSGVPQWRSCVPQLRPDAAKNKLNK